MSNDLITIPSWNPAKLRYIINIELNINNYTRYTKSIVDTRYLELKKMNARRGDSRNSHLKYLFSTYRDDPLKEFKKLKYSNSKLLWDRFISTKIQILQHAPAMHIDTFDEEITYWSINESIVPYLEAKIDKDHPGLIELKQLFEQNNNSNQDSLKEYCKNKAEYLGKLDLSNFVNEMNAETAKKINGKYIGEENE